MTRRSIPPVASKAILRDLAAPIRAGALDTTRLSEIMTARLGGSDAEGVWSWRDAFDHMQSAALGVVRDLARGNPAAGLAGVEALSASLPTETRRTERQVRLQQFSTPLPYAAAAVEAAALRPGDVVLEPSAGTGALAGLAAAAGARVHVNELDAGRASLLGLVSDWRVTRHDAEFIDDLLDPGIRPSVVLMNPPFSSTAARAADPEIAGRHVIAAAKRLAAGGRLVAIVPPAFCPARQAALWERLVGVVSPVLRLRVPGRVYARLGTGVETHLIVMEKPGQGQPVVTPVADLACADPGAVLAAVRSHLPPRQDMRRDVRPVVCRPRPGPIPPSPASAPRHEPRKTGIAPLSYRTNAEARINPAISDVYARYAPQRLIFDGARAHPTPLVESVAMGAVAPPDPGPVRLTLPERLVSRGDLSGAQLESIALAVAAHGRDLPGRFRREDGDRLVRADKADGALAFRQGYFIGDGTGCGKGRQVAGVILANWLEGRRRAIWVSKSASLIEDAIRDWTDLGGDATDIQPLSRRSVDEAIRLEEGVLFVTWALLRSVSRSGKSRLQQILDWAGADFDGVIAFDEAHAMQNAGGRESGDGRRGAASQQGLAGLRLQSRLPRARILYVSATGATEVANLAYAARLGLWGDGPGYAFPSREAFVAAMEAGGVAAMEVVARDLKALGLYSARALSFEGVEYDVLEHALTPEQIGVWGQWADAFRTIHNNLNQALMATGVSAPDGQTETGAGAARAAALSAFESTKQRFFNHLLLSMKADTVIAAIEADIAEGWAPVLQIVSTGASLLARRLDRLDPEDALTPGALTPRENVLGYLEQGFPVQVMQLVETDGVVAAEPLLDEAGRPVISREAEALRHEMMEALMLLPPTPSALDRIIWAFGPERVAEVTGRTMRPLLQPDGSLRIERRSPAAGAADTRAFMAGEKDLLIFSEAGGTGRSYHAAAGAANQRRRRHYLMEPGWRADVAIQGLGRTHRSAQAHAPFFRLCATDVHGEKRFTSTIARRLDTLGALTKGQRETGTQGLFRPGDNLESPQARAALRRLYGELAAGQIAEMPLERFSDWTGLRLTTKEGVLKDDLPPMARFLNRVLALPVAMQNLIFAAFTTRIAEMVRRAREAGTLDVGIEAVRADRIVAGKPECLRTCPATGARTELIPLRTERARVWPSADEVLKRHPELIPMRRSDSGAVALVSPRPLCGCDPVTAQPVTERDLVRPRRKMRIAETTWRRQDWRAIGRDAFIAAWDAERADLPACEVKDRWLLSGLLLPIWREIPGESRKVRRVETDQGDALIGRLLGPDEAARLRDRFGCGAPVSDATPAGWLEQARALRRAVEIGGGFSIQCRRVAGRERLEVLGAGPGDLPWLRSIGCFTEIHSWQLRVFAPFGEGADTEAVLAAMTGQSGQATEDPGEAAA